MSHYIVVLATKTGTQEEVDEILAPYNENIDETNREFGEFEDIEDDRLVQYETETTKGYRLKDGRVIAQYDKSLKNPNYNWTLSWKDRESIPEYLPPYTGAELEDIPFKELHSDFESFMDEWGGAGERDSLTNRYGYWRNPNAKWDWYSIGGRWSGYFQLHNDAEGELGESGAFGNEPVENGVDIVLKKNIDFTKKYSKYFDQYTKRYELARSIVGTLGESFISWKEARELYANDIESARNHYNTQPAIQALRKDTSKEFGWIDAEEEEMLIRSINSVEYADIHAKASIVPYAILDENGWHSRSEMGWFGVSYDEKMSEDEWRTKGYDLLTSYPDDTFLVAVDCHI
jgi:hypothetical protein